MPTVIAAKGFQIHPGFVAKVTPKLSCPLEPHLVLPTDGLHRPAAQGLAPLLRSTVVQALDRLARRTFHVLAHLFQFGDEGATGVGLKFIQQRADPRPRRVRIVGVQREYYSISPDA